jgi:hypothetical protein
MVFSGEGLALPTTETAVAHEAEYQTGMRPVRCEISKFSKDTDIETGWIISFPPEVKKCQIERSKAAQFYEGLKALLATRMKK